MIQETIQKLRETKLKIAELQAQVVKLGRELLAETQREIDGKITISTIITPPIQVPLIAKKRGRFDAGVDAMQKRARQLKREGKTGAQIQKALKLPKHRVDYLLYVR